MAKVRIFPNIDKELYIEAMQEGISWSKATELGVKLLLEKTDSKQREIERLEKKVKEHTSKLNYFKGELSRKISTSQQSKDNQERLKELLQEKIRIIRRQMRDGELSNVSARNIHYIELKNKGWNGDIKQFKTMVTGV